MTKETKDSLGHKKNSENNCMIKHHPPKAKNKGFQERQFKKNSTILHKHKLSI